MSSELSVVVVYTTRFCGYCRAALRLLAEQGVAFQEVAADGRPDLRDWLQEASQQRTVPQVFIHGVSVGGYTELSALVIQGLLDERLAAPPAIAAEPLRS